MVVKREIDRGSIYRTCKGCDKTFEIPKVFYTAPNGRVTHRWNQRVYCSTSCFKLNKKLKDRFQICANTKCNKTFKQEVKIYKGKKTPVKNKYCSRDCYRIGRSQMPFSVTCKICDKQFITSNRLIATKLCSVECRTKAKQQTQHRSRDKKYNENPGTYEALLQMQDHRCAICRKYPSGKRGLAFDHCHETNHGRGLLCHKCNMGLGMFNDDWLILDNAIEYLAHWHNKHGSSKVQSIQETPLLN
jgi:hypothetical protein